MNNVGILFTILFFFFFFWFFETSEMVQLSAPTPRAYRLICQVKPKIWDTKQIREAFSSPALQELCLRLQVPQARWINCMAVWISPHGVLSCFLALLCLCAMGSGWSLRVNTTDSIYSKLPSLTWQSVRIMIWNVTSHIVFFFVIFIIFYWSIVDLQWVDFRCIEKWLYIYICSFSDSFPL